MKTTRILSLLALLLGTSVGLYARDLTDGILVRLPHEIVVNEKRLPAGEYEFRKDPNAAHQGRRTPHCRHVGQPPQMAGGVPQAIRRAVAHQLSPKTLGTLPEDELEGMA